MYARIWFYFFGKSGKPIILITISNSDSECDFIYCKNLAAMIAIGNVNIEGPKPFTQQHVLFCSGIIKHVANVAQS